MTKVYGGLFFVGLGLFLLPILFAIIGSFTIGSGDANAYAAMIGLIGIVAVPVLTFIGALTAVFGILWHLAKERERAGK